VHVRTNRLVHTLLLLALAGSAAAQAALEPGRTLRLEFPDLPPTLRSMWNHREEAPAVTVRLPDDYSTDARFPLFVHLEGGHGGDGANLRVPMQVTRGKGYVTANFPLFKRLQPDPDVSWTIVIAPDDAAKISAAYRAILERLNAEIPNLDPARSILGGHSNGAHAIGALLSVLDPTVLSAFAGFYFVDGGLDWSTYKRTEVLGGHSLLFLVGGGHPGPPERWREDWKHRLAALRSSAEAMGMKRWRFIVVDGVGHELSPKHLPILRDWAQSVELERPK